MAKRDYIAGCESALYNYYTAYILCFPHFPHILPVWEYKPLNLLPNVPY